MPTLLMVEDNETLTRFSSLNLRAAIPGLKVYTASTCNEAAAMALEHKPEVAVLDYRLPDGDGLTLQRQLRAEHPNIQTIMISAAWNAELRHQAEIQQAFKVLDKPFETDALIRAVNQALTIHDALASRSLPPPKPAPDDKKVIYGPRAQQDEILDKIRKVLVIDEGSRNSELECVVRAAFRRAQTHIAINGLEAFDMMDTARDFDFVVYNIDIPGMDFRSFLKAMHQPAYCQIPVMVVSSTGRENDLWDAMTLGARAKVISPWKTQRFRDNASRIFSANKLAGTTKSLMQMTTSLVENYNRIQKDE